MQWTGGYAPRFQAFFLALSVSRFDGESHPAHLPLTRAVGLQTGVLFEGYNSDLESTQNLRKQFEF